MAKNTEICQ